MSALYQTDTLNPEYPVYCMSTSRSVFNQCLLRFALHKTQSTRIPHILHVYITVRVQPVSISLCTRHRIPEYLIYCMSTSRSVFNQCLFHSPQDIEYQNTSYIACLNHGLCSTSVYFTLHKTQNTSYIVCLHHGPCSTSVYFAVLSTSHRVPEEVSHTSSRSVKQMMMCTS